MSTVTLSSSHESYESSFDIDPDLIQASNSISQEIIEFCLEHSSYDYGCNNTDSDHFENSMHNISESFLPFTRQIQVSESECVEDFSDEEENSYEGSVDDHLIDGNRLESSIEFDPGDGGRRVTAFGDLNIELGDGLSVRDLSISFHDNDSILSFGEDTLTLALDDLFTAKLSFANGRLLNLSFT